MAQYRVITLDLSVAHQDRTELVPPRTLVESLTVLELPAGTDLQLYLGNKPDALPVRAEGMRIEWQECDGENDGIFYTNTAQPGTLVKVYIGFGATVSASQ